LKTIAVAGIGAIGSIVGGRMTAAGNDVNLICTSWRENAEFMKKNGLTMVGADGVEQTVKVKVLFIDELDRLSSKIDVLFIAVKSNDTVKCLTALKPYLSENSCVISLQNGINEDVIIPIVGEQNVVACVSYTGGILLRPGYVRGHGGNFVIGELDGRVTERIRELAEIMSSVTTTEISGNVIKQRWDKLSQVTTTVPAGVVTGAGFPAVLFIEKAHPLMARLMTETLRVAAADGYALQKVAGLSAAEWQRLSFNPDPELSRVVKGPFSPPEGAAAPAFNPDESPMLKDIKLGWPLEIEFTNGYVIKKGRELGVPTPTHELIVKMIRDIESGKKKTGMDLLDEILSSTAAN